MIVPYQWIPINATRATAALQGEHIVLCRTPIGELKNLHRLRAVAERHTASIVVLGRDAVLANWEQEEEAR